MSALNLASNDLSTQKPITEVHQHPVTQEISVVCTPKDARFWLVFLAICITLFLSALDYVGISVSSVGFQY